MKTIIKIMVAAIVAAGMVCVMIMHDASDKAVIVTFFCVGIMLCAILGVFDEPARAKFDSIRRRMGISKSRSYGQAA